MSRTTVAYTKALTAHARIELQLVRALNRWQKSRATIRRLEKKLDTEATGVAP